MKAALMAEVAAGITRDLRALIAADGDQVQGREPIAEGPPDSDQVTRRRAYAPMDGSTPPPPPAGPWGSVALLDVGTTGDLLVITFRWSPTGQVFAHVSNLAEFLDDARLAAGIIQYQLQRLLLSARWPEPVPALAVGTVTIVTGLA